MLDIWQEESSESNLLCLQIPPSVPIRKSSSSGAVCTELGNVSELPEGYMGKLIVYRSGAMKMKLGDTLFDVSVVFNESLSILFVTVNE